MNQYEAMFLFDPTFGGSFEKCEAEIRRLMDRAGGEIILCRKWDERRLAYRIKGRKRGVYVLTFFRASPSKIGGIERDVTLSEDILRVLVLRADDVTPEAMERAFVAWREEPSDHDDRDGGEDRPRFENSNAKARGRDDSGDDGDDSVSADEPDSRMTPVP